MTGLSLLKWHLGGRGNRQSHLWPETSEARIARPNCNLSLTGSGAGLNLGTCTFQGIVCFGSESRLYVA